MKKIVFKRLSPQYYLFPQLQSGLLYGHLEHISSSFFIKLKYTINPSNTNTIIKITKSIKFIISLPFILFYHKLFINVPILNTKLAKIHASVV